MTRKEIIVYTDGSCSGNGKSSSHGGMGIHFPNSELKDISKVYRLDSYCTNQRTELYAILLAIRYVKKYIGLSKTELVIMSDSQYSINCVTKWSARWETNGWLTTDKKPVANRDLIEPIYRLYQKYNIEMCHVSAHTGGDDSESIANDMADYLATKATERSKQDHGSDEDKSVKSKAQIKSPAKSQLKAPTKAQSKTKPDFRKLSKMADLIDPDEIEVIFEE